MTRYEKIATKALKNRLESETAPVMLWSLACIADEACRAAGKRRDLYDSLYRYEDLLPPGWRPEWITAHGGTGDSLLMAVPPGWVPGRDNSKSLLLGVGKLEYARSND